MSNNLFLILWLIGVLASFLLSLCLLISTYKNRRRSFTIPKLATSYIDSEKIERTKRYKDEKFKSQIINLVLSSILSLALVFSLFYPKLYNLFLSHMGLLTATVLFLILSSLPDSILQLPFSIYDEFVTEKKYGFSTMTIKLFIKDGLKDLIISGVLFIVLFSLLSWFIFTFKNTWYLIAALLMICFSLAVSLVYPRFIAPIFNKFTPLEEGELKTGIAKLLKDSGFSLDKVFVMDATKRSNHSNAYFTGLGKSKRIVLYDSLINNLSTEEILAVLCHELGHYKKKHIQKSLAFGVVKIFALFLCAFYITKLDSLYTAFGFETGNTVIGLFLVLLVFGPYPRFLSPISNHISRKHEMEADMFAKEMLGTGDDLCKALLKLQAQNLSELNPSKLDISFNYSHPHVFTRVEYLSK